MMSNETNSGTGMTLFASGTLHEVLTHESNTDVFHLG
jgi:hypothetical protein